MDHVGQAMEPMQDRLRKLEALRDAVLEPYDSATEATAHLRDMADEAQLRGDLAGAMVLSRIADAVGALNE